MIEVLITLLILGLTFGLAVPGFQGIMARNRITTETNNLVTAFQMARSEAGALGGTVTVLATDGTTTNDEFGPGYCVSSADPPTCTGAIRTFAVSEGTRVDSVQDVTSIQFDSIGALANTSSNTRAFDVCVDGYNGRRVIVNLIGRTKIHRTTDPVAANQPAC